MAETGNKVPRNFVLDVLEGNLVPPDFDALLEKKDLIDMAAALKDADASLAAKIQQRSDLEK